MKIQKIQYYSKDRIPLALSNLIFNKGYELEDVYDAVEDADNEAELIATLRQIIRGEKIEYSRVTDTYVRFKFTDCLGNVRYFKVIA